jgi:hypothetical protein
MTVSHLSDKSDDWRCSICGKSPGVCAGKVGCLAEDYLSGRKLYSGLRKSVSLKRRVRAEAWGFLLGLYSSFSSPGQLRKYEGTGSRYF